MFAQTLFCLFACLLSTSTSRPIEELDKPDGVLIEKTSALELNWKVGAKHHAKSMPQSNEELDANKNQNDENMEHSIGYIDYETIFYDSDSSKVMKFKDFSDRDLLQISNKESSPAANMIMESKKGRYLDLMEDRQRFPIGTSGNRMIDSPNYGRVSSKPNSYDNVAILVNHKDRNIQGTKIPTAILADQKYIYPIKSETLVNYLPKGVPVTNLEKMKQLTSPTVFKDENNSIHILMHIPLPDGYAAAYKNPIDGREPTSILNVIKIERVRKN